MASTIDDISLIDRAVIPPLDYVPCIIPAQRHCDGRVPVAEEDQRALRDSKGRGEPCNVIGEPLVSKKPMIRKAASKEWGSLVSCVAPGNIPPPAEGKKLETAPRHRGARSPRASTAIWPEGFLTVASKPMPTTVSAAIPEVAIAYNVMKERLGGGQGSRGGDCRSCDSLNGPKEKGGGVKSMDRGSENLRDYHRRGKGS